MCPNGTTVPRWANRMVLRTKQNIADRLDIATWPAEQWAPPLNTRLTRAAMTYKLLLIREKLNDPRDKVDYCNNAIRPHFVNNAESVLVCNS